MAMANANDYLDSELAELQVTVNNLAVRFIPDAQVRREYIENSKRYSDELLDFVRRKKMSANAAALKANMMRNTLMDTMRGKSSDISRALAQFLKKEGPTLAELEEKYAKKLFKKEFSKISSAQKNEIWRLVISKAGEPRASMSNGAKWAGCAGKGFFAPTVIIAVYHIANSENKVRATANECAAVGGGAGGAYVGGAAGFLCGPAAIACVPLGVFIGGIGGAAGADWIFDQLWK